MTGEDFETLCTTVGAIAIGAAIGAAIGWLLFIMFRSALVLL